MQVEARRTSSRPLPGIPGPTSSPNAPPIAAETKPVLEAESNQNAIPRQTPPQSPFPATTPSSQGDATVPTYEDLVAHVTRLTSQVQNLSTALPPGPDVPPPYAPP